MANPIAFYIGAVLRGDTFHGRRDTNNSESTPSSIQSAEVYWGATPLTYIAGQESRHYFAACKKGIHWTSIANVQSGDDVCSEEKERGLLSSMGRHGSPEIIWGNIPGRRHSRCRGLGQNMLCWGDFLQSQLLGGGETHKSSSAPTEDCGKTEGMGNPWRNWREWQVQSCIFLLCPGTLLPGSGTEGPVCIDRQGWERTPTKPAQWITKLVWGWAGKADGGRRQRSLFSEDLELLPEHGREWEGRAGRGLWRAGAGGWAA